MIRQLLTPGIILLMSVSLVDCTTSNDPAPDLQMSMLDKKMEHFQNPEEDYVMVATHRGFGSNAPENSIMAIKKAIDSGVDIIEIDVRITKDNKLVLMHDQELDRTTTGSGLVKYHTLTELKNFFLKDQDGTVTTEQIPTLEESLNLAKDKVLVMIDKSEFLAGEILEVAKQTNTLDQIIFLWFDDLAVVQERLGDDITAINYIPGVHESNDHINTYIQDFNTIVDPLSYAFWIKTESSPLLSTMATMKKSRRIWVNTTESDQCAGHTDAVSVSNPDNGWGWVMAKGATIILTDEPIRLLSYLRSKNVHD